MLKISGPDAPPGVRLCSGRPIREAREVIAEEERADGRRRDDEPAGRPATTGGLERGDERARRRHHRPGERAEERGGEDEAHPLFAFDPLERRRVRRERDDAEPAPNEQVEEREEVAAPEEERPPSERAEEQTLPALAGPALESNLARIHQPTLRPLTARVTRTTPDESTRSTSDIA